MYLHHYISGSMFVVYFLPRSVLEQYTKHQLLQAIAFTIDAY